GALTAAVGAVGVVVPSVAQAVDPAGPHATGRAAAGVRIAAVQGAGHVSPLAGTAVTGVPGVVTATTSNGFWMQDPQPDAEPATSDGVFVFTGSAPAAKVGDAVTVDGKVTEYRSGGAATT